MALRRNIVHMAVDPKFFNRFEEARRKTQKKMGIDNLTQRKFTSLMAMNPNLFRQVSPKILTKNDENKKKRRN